MAFWDGGPHRHLQTLEGTVAQEVGNGQVAIEELDFRGISAEEEPGSVQSVGVEEGKLSLIRFFISL